MTAPVLFFIFVIAGLMLIGMELFVPGGILGGIGAIALVGAMVTGFFAFPGLGVYIALAILLMLGLCIFIWARFFPETPLGRQMAVEQDLGEAKGTESGLDDLLSLQGEALSDLRPAGYARLDGKRVDVVSRGGMIEKGSTVEVVEVESNRVVVKQV